MCIGRPMQVLAVEGDEAICVTGERRARIDIRLVPDAAAGDWLLVFLGAARRAISAEEAAMMADALGALEAAMAGETLDAHFADLAGGPRLPDHMEAACRTGAKLV